LEKPTHAIIVLSQLDTRYFKEIAGISSWTLEFALVKRGETDPLSEATPTLLYSRSVNLEIDLDVGEYVVYVRLDRTTFKEPDYFKKGVDSGWDHRKLSRILTERAKGRSIASNFTPGIQAKYLPTELSELIERDLAQYKKEQEKRAKKTETEDAEDGTTVTVTTVTTTTTTKTEKVVKKNVPDPTHEGPKGETYKGPPLSLPPIAPEVQAVDSCEIDPGHVRYRALSPLLPMPLPMPRSLSPLPPPPPPPPPVNNVPSNNIEIYEDEDTVYLGLRVYTNKDAPAKVGGKLKGEMDYFGDQRASRSPLRHRYPTCSPSPRR
jgi:hypothetical protein